MADYKKTSKSSGGVDIYACENKGGEYSQHSLDLMGKKVPVGKATVQLVDGPYGGKKPA